VVSLQIRLEVDSNTPLYEITMNDGGSDGGTNFSYYISGELQGSTTSADFETAVQDFANSLSVATNQPIVSIKNVAVNETTL
jgi:hypothetical protein